MDQRDARERQAKGKDHGEAKLTEGEVLEIRARYATGRATQQGLADQYGVGDSTISRIVNRKLWTHL
jgi:DNA-binding MarR family transcriptional regulator